MYMYIDVHIHVHEQSLVYIEHHSAQKKELERENGLELYYFTYSLIGLENTK